MSVNPDGPDGVTYSDHEVQHIRHDLDIDETFSGSTETVTEEFNITERGLDNDELAELVHFTVRTGIIQGGQATDDPNPGFVRMESGAGFNLAGSEFLLDSPNSESITTGLTEFTRNTDEVGQVWSVQLSSTAPNFDSTNGAAASDEGNILQYSIDYRDKFGSGPFLDSTDDFNSKHVVTAENLDAAMRVISIYTLVYDVQELERGRSRFGMADD